MTRQPDRFGFLHIDLNSVFLRPWSSRFTRSIAASRWACAAPWRIPVLLIAASYEAKALGIQDADQGRVRQSGICPEIILVERLA